MFRGPKSVSCSLLGWWLNICIHYGHGLWLADSVDFCLFVCLFLLFFSCLLLSSLALSCLLFSCLVLSCLVLSCLVLSSLLFSSLLVSSRLVLSRLSYPLFFFCLFVVLLTPLALRDHPLHLQQDSPSSPGLAMDLCICFHQLVYNDKYARLLFASITRRVGCRLHFMAWA
jgi:hypothetical protein